MTSWLERALACVEQIEKVCDRGCPVGLQDEG